MTASSFMLQDIVSTLLGALLFPIVLIAPGYIAGWTLDLFDFRARLLHSRLALALILSIAISPVLFYLLFSLFSFQSVFIILITCVVIFFIFLIVDKPAFPVFRSNRAMIWVAVSVFVWILISLFSIIDMQIGNEIYLSMTAFDQTTRISLVDAITRTGVPPVNPSYYPGHPVELSFLYFFWYILGSIIDQIGGVQVDARGAFFASIIWCGIAMMIVIAFYLRLRNKANGTNIWNLVLIGIGLLLITGLDVLPASMAFGVVSIGDIEHWNEQITAWVGSLLWVPHHVAALIACLVGAWLALAMREQAVMRRYTLMTVAGIAFASALGLSVWVTLVFVFFWGAWILVCAFQAQNRKFVLPMLFAGCVALVFSANFLMGIFASLGGSSESGSTLPIIFEVRAFLLLDAFTTSAPKIVQSLLRLIFLPLNYFLELGFFFLAAVLWVRQKKQELTTNPYYFMELTLLGTSFFVGTFMRSTLISNNDLGWRAWLPGQFVLLIWGADVLNQLIRSWRMPAVFSLPMRTNLIILLALGITTTLVDLYLLRFVYFISFGPEVGSQIYSARMAYTTIQEVLPENVIVQYNPASFINRPSGLYGMRQSAISDRTFYGISQDVYKAKASAVQELFDLQNISGWQSVDSLCRQHFIDVLVLNDRDSLWTSLPALRQERPPLYMDENYAVFTCGNYAASHLP